MSGFTPVNQVRLTNVAYVRLHRGGKRFEIACYRNKALNWRNKIETDIREVLQIDTVFTNVSKGTLASTKDLLEQFGTTDQMQVCQEILNKGELQVSEQEREALNESVFRDIAGIVVDKTVNPETNRPYTVSIIQNAMKQIQFSVNVTKSAKSQALEIIRKLRAVMPIARASMLVRAVCLTTEIDEIRDALESLGAEIVGDSRTAESETSVKQALNGHVDVCLDPELYRKTEEMVKEKSAGMRLAPTLHGFTFAGAGRLEILQLRAAALARHGGLLAHPHEDAKEEEDTNRNEEHVGIAERAEKPDKVKAKIKGNELSKLLSELIDSDGEASAAGAQANTDYDLAMGMVKRAKHKSKKAGNGDEEKQPPKVIAEEAPEAEGGKGGKKSKKSRRLEKEEEKEREQKILSLQQRLQKHASVADAAPQETAAEPAVSSKVSSSDSIAKVLVPAAAALVPAAASHAAAGKVQSCNTCGGEFRDSTAYRNHFRSEWHRYNLNRKMKSLPTIASEEEFLKLSIRELAL